MHAFTFTTSISGTITSAQTHLPPLPQWKGKSEALLQSASSKYATPFEKSNGLKSASIEEFETWFDNISINNQQISKKTIALTAEGQQLNAYVFSENSSMRDSLNAAICHWCSFRVVFILEKLMG